MDSVNGFNGIPQGLQNNNLFARELADPNSPAYAGGKIAREQGVFTLPHVITFSSVFGSAYRTYSWRWDEAYKNSRCDALAMRRDAFLMGILQERILASSQLNWHIECEDPKDQRQRKCAEFITNLIRRMRGLPKFFYNLQDATWYGRMAAHIAWTWRDDIKRPDGIPGHHGEGRVLCPERYYPINGDKIQYRYRMYDDGPEVEDGIPVILTHSSYATRLPKSETVLTDRGRGLLLRSPYWRERFVLHSHTPDDADFFEAEMAGGIWGVGIRSRIYWLDWIRKEWLANVSDYIQRVGQGFIIIYYEAGNPQSETKAIEVGNNISNNTVVVWPRPIGTEKQGAGLEMINPPMSGSETLVKLMEHLEQIIERYIIGQTASSRSGAGGLGVHNTEAQDQCVPVCGTEILTRRGFRKPHDVVIGEDVLAYDTETDTCRWTPLLDKSFYDNRPTVRLKYQSADAPLAKRTAFDVCCTDRHTWPACYWGVKGWDEKRGRKLVETKNLTSHHAIIIAAKEVETTDSLLTPTEAALLGWAVTDGHIKRSGHNWRLGVCQSKEENFDSIREVIPAGTHEWVGKPTVRTFPTGRTYSCKRQHWWYLSTAAATDLIDKAGYTERADLPGIVTQLSKEARAAMLEAMIRAEGTKCKQFFQKCPHVMEAFEILCALQGVRTGRTTPRWRCNAKRIMKHRHVSCQHVVREDSAVCDVWCPTTKYGTWVMRQGGRVMITGNTKSNIVRYDAKNLADSLTHDLIPVLMRWNCPEEDYHLEFRFDVDKPNAKDLLDGAYKVWSMGGHVREDNVLEYAGLPKVDPQDDVLLNPQFQQQPGGEERVEGGLQPGGEEPEQPPGSEPIPPPEEGYMGTKGLPGGHGGPRSPDISAGFGAALGGPKAPSRQSARPYGREHAKWHQQQDADGPYWESEGGRIERSQPTHKDNPSMARAHNEQGQTVPNQTPEQVNPLPKKPAGKNTENLPTDGPYNEQEDYHEEFNKASEIQPATQETLKQGVWHQLRSGEVSEVKENPNKGANSSYVVTLADGKKGLFKPPDLGRNLYFPVPGNYIGREVATSEVAHILGMGDLVPETVVRQGMKDTTSDVGSMQAFVNEGASALQLPDEEKFDGPENLARAAIFDALTMQGDRAERNWLIAGDRPSLIDNGYTFPDNHTPLTGEEYKKREAAIKAANPDLDAKQVHSYASGLGHDSDLLKRAVDTDLPFPDLSGWKDKWPEIEATLKRNKIDDKSIGLAKERFDLITSPTTGDARLDRARKRAGASGWRSFKEFWKAAKAKGIVGVNIDNDLPVPGPGPNVEGYNAG
ncbi:hypothetical protein AYO40_01070 [Planctomycetaceae bacterium SCGC AG-212-D15]|nr:hypothetical protein AYO40_01070 [Planctomycetaceae bacterium SCGC AG-212-D15]